MREGNGQIWAGWAGKVVPEAKCRAPKSSPGNSSPVICTNQMSVHLDKNTKNQKTEYKTIGNGENLVLNKILGKQQGFNWVG